MHKDREQEEGKNKESEIEEKPWKDKKFSTFAIFTYSHISKIHIFCRIWTYITLKAPSCSQEHETFIYSNLFNCFQFVFFSFTNKPEKTFFEKIKVFFSLETMLLWASLISNVCYCWWWVCGDGRGKRRETFFPSRRVWNRKKIYFLWKCEEWKEFSPFFL